MEEGLASSKLQYEGRIQVLEKELSRYMRANQELSQRLNSINLHPGAAKGESRPRLCFSYQLQDRNLNSFPQWEEFGAQLSPQGIVLTWSKHFSGPSSALAVEILKLISLFPSRGGEKCAHRDL